ncbi:MAG: pyrroline-5-carboxylate reductase [Mariprofundus sp.]|nr:pyrroline-5-carboxylate reductase [Mariprofundus sp.]
MQHLTIAFIGGGNMAEALISGLMKGGHPAAKICVADPVGTRCEFLRETYGTVIAVDNAEAAACADLLVLAVKPQQMQKVAATLGASLKEEATVISIAAGVRLGSIAEWLGVACHVVRVMPNTPALVGAGMSVLYSEASDFYRQRASYLMQASGAVEWVDSEQQMHAVTALSGSGPAYFFLLAEVMQATGVALGLSETLAGKLATQTAFGAGKIMVESGRTPSALRQQVSSPGGTTLAALDVMLEQGLPDTVRAALTAASKRSQELAA